jgi:hypothetical protein
LASLEAGLGTTSDGIAKKVSVLDAIHMLSSSWQSVKPTTIQNCFNKAFSLHKGEQEVDALHDVPTPRNMERNEFEDLVDQDFLTGKDLQDEDVKSDDDQDEEEVESSPLERVSPKECLEALAKVRSFCQAKELGASVHNSLKKIETECLLDAIDQHSVQKRITEFFK